jgi:hypothetical protein
MLYLSIACATLNEQLSISRAKEAEALAVQVEDLTSKARSLQTALFAADEKAARLEASRQV